MIILGVCESGRFRRSVSDEPIGFPGLLIQGGVDAVIAPMWEVDDFSSHIFLTKFWNLLVNGNHPASAIYETALWLRELKSQEVIEYMKALHTKIENIRIEMGSNAVKYLHSKLKLMESWLNTKDKNFCPFMSPQDWAAFQIIGTPLLGIGDQ